jgi:hypothetical protein
VLLTDAQNSLHRIGELVYLGNTNSVIAPGRDTVPGFFMRTANDPSPRIRSIPESAAALPLTFGARPLADFVVVASDRRNPVMLSA